MISMRFHYFLLLFLLSGCLGERSAYRHALIDARKPEKNEICDTLVALTKSDPRADLRVINGTRYPSLVTWALDSNVVFRDSTGQWRASEDIWVTSEPELKEKCSKLLKQNSDETNRQLRYLLGLPPGYDGTIFIRFRAPLDSVFRPCPDPEVTDTRCQLTFPEKTPERHRKWMKETLEASYSSSKLYERFPWTRLGYTYNWAPNAQSEYGLSEFVVHKGTPLIEVQFESIEEFCHLPER